jgi:hypothetical protein
MPESGRTVHPVDLPDPVGLPRRHLRRPGGRIVIDVILRVGADLQFPHQAAHTRRHSGARLRLKRLLYNFHP